MSETTLVSVREPITPTEKEINLAEISSRVLAQHIKNKDVRSIKIVEDSESSETVEIPNIAFRLLVDILVHISRGDTITVRPIHAELTTQEAADFLNVSRPFLVKLLEEGKMPYHKIGTHRRVLFKDLLEFKRKHQEEQEKNMDELVALGQELGLGFGMLLQSKLGWRAFDALFLVSILLVGIFLVMIGV